MTIAAWPVVSDDTGAYTDGTVFNKALTDAMHDAVDALLVSSANPGVSAANIIDEVVTARGSLANLDARLDVLLNEDGTIKTPSGIVTAAQLQAQAAASINLLKNSTFWIWPETLALAPAYWAVSNGTAAIAGAGQADTTRKVGRFCAKLTHTTGVAKLTQIILDATDFSNLDHLKGETKKIAMGMWVKTATTNHGRLSIVDGSGSTPSSYHTGGGAFEFLTVVHTMSAASTKLQIELENAQSGDVYFSGGVVIFGDAAPALWYPEPKVRGHASLELAGDLTVGDGKKYLTFARPIRLDHINALIATDPTGASVNIDFEKYETAGPGWQSMGTAGALIDDGDGVGDWLFTTTATLLHDRCLKGWFGASGEREAAGQENAMARLNIDQIGATIAGADLFLRVDGVQCVHPFEDQYAFNDQGV